MRPVGTLLLLKCQHVEQHKIRNQHCAINYSAFVDGKNVFLYCVRQDDVNTKNGRREVVDGTVFEILEGARLHFIKFETSQGSIL